MSYESVRKREIISNNIRMAEELVKRYNPNRKTVILLPGGLGSQLEKTVKKYSESNPGPFDKYETVWIDIDIVFTIKREIFNLEIQKNGRDRGDFIVVPNGPVRFFAKPYDATERFFRNKEYNYAVFGYDWRRRVDEPAAFLEDFLRRFRDGVIKRFQNDKSKNPLRTTTLLCHSQGGLVAKLFLHRVLGKSGVTPEEVSEWMEQVITVATPFYGTSNHVRRYYKGQKDLNIIYGPRIIAETAGTLPGPYILMLLDKNSYEKDKDRLEIAQYPVRDTADETIEVDPYAASTLSRYPKWIRKESLEEARKLRGAVRRELAPAVLERVFHVRSGKDEGTIVEQFWSDIDGSKFDPVNDEFPIMGRKGPGDGTVPFWSAKLAQTPPEQTYSLQKAKDHSELLEHEETLNVVTRIIEKGKIPQLMPVADLEYIGGPKATDQAVEQFLTDVKEGRITLDNNLALNESFWRKIIEEVALC